MGGFWGWVKSLFGCRCGGPGAADRLVVVGAKTVTPDRPLTCEFEGRIRSFGNDFLFEIVPVVGLRIQDSSGGVRLAELHFFERDREATEKALSELIDGNAERIPAGFRMILEAAAPLAELQKMQDAGDPVEVSLRAVYSYADGSPDVSSAVFPGRIEFRYDNPNLHDTYFMQEAFILWYCYEKFYGSGKSKKKGWTMCGGWCVFGSCLCRKGPPPAAICLGWVKCSCM